MTKNTKKNIIGGILIVIIIAMLFHPVRVELCKATQYKICIAIEDSAWIENHVRVTPSSAGTVPVKTLK